METADNTVMHVTETKTLCSSLNCPKTTNEEITKEREEELLYGSNEDGDEDALSEDSFRLTYSDEGEEQQTTNKDVASEVMKPPCTQMELGADVSPSEMMERKNMLKGEKVTNGNYPNEKDLNEVEKTKNKAESSSSDKLKIKMEETNGEIDELRNGDIEKNVNILTDSNSSNKQWNYSGHFGDYSKQPRPNSVSTQPSVPNSSNVKYYNQNAHYGRDKNCLRGFKLHNRKETRANIDPSSNDSLTNHTSSPSENERRNDCEISPKARGDDSTVDSPDTNISSGKKVVTEVCDRNEVQNDVVNNVSESCELLLKNKNVQETSDCTVSADSTREENRDENDSSKCEKSSRILEEGSNEIDIGIKDINDGVNNATDADLPVVESTNVDEDSADLNDNSSVENPSNSTGEEKISVQDTIDQKIENSAPEIRTERVNEVEETSENTRESESDENFEAETNKKLENNEKNSLQISKESANHISDESEISNDLKSMKNECEVKISKKEDKIVSETRIDCDKDETVLFGKVDETMSDKNSKEISIVETDELNSEKNSVVNFPKELHDELDIKGTNDSKSTEKNEETDSKKSEKKKLEEEVKKISEPVTDVDSLNETKENECSISSEKLDNNSKSLQQTKDSSVVAIGESKTNDEKTNVLTDKNVTSEPNILLTDGEKNVILSSNNDDEKSVNDNVTNKVATLRSSLKRTLSELLLDEMDLSKRIQMERKKNENTSESSVKENHSSQVLSETVTDEISNTDKNIDTSNVENTVTNSNGENVISGLKEGTIIDNVVEKSSGPRRNVEEKSVAQSDDHEADNDERIDDCEVIEVPAKRKQKRSRKSLNILRENSVSQDDSQEIENVRQRRKTARNAEEMIRKECLANTDSESNDSLSKFVTISHKTNNHLRATSPPTLKRNYVDDEVKTESTTTKRIKSDVTLNGDISMKSESVESETKQTLLNVRQFFRRDANGSLCKLRQEELEELLIQKIVETITMRDEIGKLREQAKVSERNQEATRLRCQQLAKQIKDFEMVLSRYKADLRSNPDSKTVVPIKINRSVGLQVNFVTDHGIQNLRQLQQAQKILAGGAVNGTIAAHQQQQQKQPAQQLSQPQGEPIISNVKRTVKVRSPRRPEIPTTTPVITAVSTPVNSSNASTITPTALVVSKSVSDSRPSVTSANQQTSGHPQLISSNQTILVNGNLTNQSIRQSAALQASKTKNSDLIDLTQEEEKTKTPGSNILTATHKETSSNVPNVQKIAPRFHTVIQTIPGNMAITAQSGIRVVQPSSQPTPTALVNNMNAPRLAYVTMQSGMVPRQVVLTSTPTPIRPAPTNNIRTTFPIPGTISNSTVRVIPATGAPPLVYKHPAALPESLNTMSSPSWKLPPPAPSLKISKVANGIVLSWNMALSDKYAEIASYQLYAYQEISGIAPSSTLWKKVGDVRALPLPMACTLTQFSEGNNYYFAVRAVDKHSRLGQYSQPGNISL